MSMFVEIPVLPLPLAIFCCVINFILPGIGTMIAGCCSCCCDQQEELEESCDCCKCCELCFEGFKQLLGAIVGVGWCFSCYTGLLLVDISLRYHKSNKVEDVNAGTSVIARRRIIQPNKSPTLMTEQPGAGSIETYLQNVDHNIHVITGNTMLYDGTNLTPGGKSSLVFDPNIALGPDGDIYPAICYVHPVTDHETFDYSSTN